MAGWLNGWPNFLHANYFTMQPCQPCQSFNHANHTPMLTITSKLPNVGTEAAPAFRLARHRCAPPPDRRAMRYP